jgi:hypothetical protein
VGKFGIIQSMYLLETIHPSAASSSRWHPGKVESGFGQGKRSHSVCGVKDGR